MTVSFEERVKVLEKVVEGQMQHVEAAVKLSCSVRTVFRQVARYRRSGTSGLIHGLKGRRSNRAKPDMLRDEVVALYTSRYSGMAVSAFTRDVVAGQGIELSRETVRKWLIDAGMHWAKARKSKIEDRR